MKTKTNHEVVILDASASMTSHASAVVKVTDTLISHLAGQVKTFPEQETRISVYEFSTHHPSGANLRNLVWDMDVLRMPSIAGMYHPGGGTPLCEAVVRVIADISSIPVHYGDHAMLVYLITDGGEGGEHSLANYRDSLRRKLPDLPDTWTVAGMVPGINSRRMLINYGFHPGNIEIWDPSRTGGVEELGERLVATASAYSAGRDRGMSSTRSLFTMAAPSVKDIQDILAPITPGSYYFEEVTEEDLAKIQAGRIDQFMAMKTGIPYVPGRAYYQMTRRERVQYYKQVAVAIPNHGAKTVDVYMGDGAREMLQLPPSSSKKEVRVSPGKWKDYKVFIGTGSMNRRLYPGTSVLVMR